MADDQGPAAGAGGNLDPTTREKLRQTIARIERLEEEKKQIADAIKDVYLEAKSFGFDVKAIRQVVRLRKRDRAEREEQDLILAVYLAALGEI